MPQPQPQHPRADMMSMHPWPIAGARLGVLAALLGALAAASGCAVGPRYRAPDIQALAQFDAAAAATASPGAAATVPGPAPEIAQWWHALHDTELDSLVERAVKANPDVQLALDRLQAARTFEIAV